MWKLRGTPALGSSRSPLHKVKGEEEGAQGGMRPYGLKKAACAESTTASPPPRLPSALPSLSGSPHNHTEFNCSSLSLSPVLFQANRGQGVTTNQRCIRGPARALSFSLQGDVRRPSLPFPSLLPLLSFGMARAPLPFIVARLASPHPLLSVVLSPWPAVTHKLSPTTPCDAVFTSAPPNGTRCS